LFTTETLWLFQGGCGVAAYKDIRLTDGFSIRRTIGKDLHHETHYHDALEIGIIERNEARYQLEGADYFGKPGDVFICRPFEAHWSYNTDPAAPYHSIMILFSPSVMDRIPDGHRLLIPFYATHWASPLIPAETSCAQRIREAANRAISAADHRNIAWRTLKWIGFMEILVQIYTYFMENIGVETKRSASGEMLSTIGILLSSITEEINMEQLIAESSMGKTLFYRTFKQLTGISPNQFINRLRLQIAAEQMVQTPKTIMNIAMDSGFPCLSTFNKQFKQYFGCAPIHYRQQRRPSERS
jgi:AraC-like DNA-binding protein